VNSSSSAISLASMPVSTLSKNHNSCTRGIVNNPTNRTLDNQLRTRRKVAKMLIAVVIMFSINFFPVHFLPILQVICLESDLKMSKLLKICPFKSSLLLIKPSQRAHQHTNVSWSSWSMVASSPTACVTSTQPSTLLSITSCQLNLKQVNFWVVNYQPHN